MAQSLLHRQQHRPVVSDPGADLGEDHPVGMQAGGGKARGEQVGGPQRPQDLSSEPCGDAGDEQDGSSLVGRAGLGRNHLVQGAESQSAFGQCPVQRLEAERQHAGTMLPLACLQVADAPAEAGQGPLAAWRRHRLPWCVASCS